MGVIATEMDKKSTTVGSMTTTKTLRRMSLLVKLTIGRKEIRLRMLHVVNVGLSKNLCIQLSRIKCKKCSSG